MKKKLNTFDYLSDLPKGCNVEDYVEVQFKNTRKGYYLNSLKLPLFKGDVVAVEATPGHDIGTVSLTGKLVELQMRKANYRNNGEPKRIYRIAKQTDIDKFEECKALEHDTMIRSRQIALDLGLDMKIGDVEYQGDGQKAIFYYIADGRVDFRQLIKKLAEAFHVRIEMKQIGARQEAARIGGIGPCGRQLCCSGFLTNFVSVGTNAARLQDLSMNPQKLAGQCAKLKCCLNYEVDVYFEAQRRMPSREIELETSQGAYRHFKGDALSGTVYYINKNPKESGEIIGLSTQRVFQIINMNKRGDKPFSLQLDSEGTQRPAPSTDILDENSLTRFDSVARRKGRNRRKNAEERRSDNPSHRPSGSNEGQETSHSENRRQHRNGNRPHKMKQREDGQHKPSGKTQTAKEA
ncbi:regulatory iron-sulfur-containing complex subunit RicT [Porphyromonas sp.]|uniref:PSP1 domain-containing protein n=1 Tax=Porphyromonas sp. TaxID=1924944 RepID=UPI0026DC3FFB|nr:regulatory iron-sulfur-containing complex subunit RicT [Porphyromonas sp.]MDO4770521.1 regulatory iron-sulfur-containing complex subunit RicT [Porphyromonas sp.]